MLPCVKCHQPASYSIRGLCVNCAPELHAQRARMLDATRRAMERFEAETGKSVFEDFDAYERMLVGMSPDFGPHKELTS